MRRGGWGRRALELGLPVLVGVAAGRWAPRWALWTFAGLIATVFAAALPLAAWGAVKALRLAWIRRRLLRTGTPVVARVAEARLWGMPLPTLDDLAVAELTLDVVSGAPSRRLTLKRTVDVDEAPEVGDEVALLVDLRRPERVRLAPPARRAGTGGR